MKATDNVCEIAAVSDRTDDIREQTMNCNTETQCVSDKSHPSPESPGESTNKPASDTKEIKNKHSRRKAGDKLPKKGEDYDAETRADGVDGKSKKNKKGCVKGDQPTDCATTKSGKGEKGSIKLGALFLPDKNPKKKKRKKNSGDIKRDDKKLEHTDDDPTRSSPQNNNLINKNKSGDSPVVVVVEDDETSNTKAAPKRKLFSSKEPLIYNCCVCCSLGAGALCGGIVFSLFCIAYLVVRAEEFKIRTIYGIWNGVHLLQDVWRVLLVIGFITSSFCLIASVILIIASCLCGTKEKYRKIRFVIGFWFLTTSAAFINNVGEAIFIQAMPNVKIVGHYHKSDKIQDIKSNNVRLWALTGIFTAFFIYISLVLVSYLRMLKYMDSPKIGTMQALDDSELPNIEKSNGKRRKRENGITDGERKTSRNVAKAQRKTADCSAPELLPRDTVEDNRSMAGNDSNRIYMNTNIPRSQRKRKESKKESKGSTENPMPNDTTNPKPPKRMPVRQDRPVHPSEAIYVNDVQLLDELEAQYTKVKKFPKPPSPPSERNPAFYELPPEDISAMDSTNDGVEGQHSEIEKMERLADELRNKQQAFDKCGSCDPVAAERLTEMALTALKLSEKILQDVKTKDNAGPVWDTEDSLDISEEKSVTQDNTQIAEEFFEELANAPKSLQLTPIEELFRIYGKDLCSQNPDLVNRYLMSYKALQDGKNNSRMMIPPHTGIMYTVMNEQRPWISIMNASEAIPSDIHLTNSGPFPQQIPSMPQSLYSSQLRSDPSSRFLPISNSLRKIEDGTANRRDNENRPNEFTGSQSSHRPINSHSVSDHMPPQQNAMNYPYSDYYYESECPCSQCNPYGDYGGSPMPQFYGFDAGINDGLYSGSNWFPLGDPAYSIDMYHNPYEVWSESPPPYTEESSMKMRRSRSRSSSSKGSRSMRKSRSSNYSFEHANSEHRGSIRDTLNSRSLPNIFNEDLYSDGPPSTNRSRRSSRSRSRESDSKTRSRSLLSSKSNLSDVTTKEAFAKGYKMALKEALKMISTGQVEGGSGVIKRKDTTFDRESIASDWTPSKSKVSRTRSNDSKVGSRRGYTDDSNFDSCSIQDYGQSTGRESDQFSSRKSSTRSSRKLSRAPRRTNKLSFRPSSRPGDLIFNDVYDGYRSDSSVPVDKSRLQDFEFPRRNSSRNSARVRSITNDSKDEDLFPSDSSSRFGRPSTRSRLPSKQSNSLKGDKIWRGETNSNGPISDNERHFYNKLNLERPRTASPVSNRNPRNARNFKRDLAHSRSQSAIPFRSQDIDMGRRSFSEASRDERESDVTWFMGDDPVYDGYNESWTEESSSYPFRTIQRSSSFSDQPRLGSSASSKRKSVTFDNRAEIKDVDPRTEFKR